MQQAISTSHQDSRAFLLAPRRDRTIEIGDVEVSIGYYEHAPDIYSDGSPIPPSIEIHQVLHRGECIWGLLSGEREEEIKTMLKGESE